MPRGRSETRLVCSAHEIRQHCGRPTGFRPTTDLYDSVLAGRRRRPVSRVPAPARLDGRPLTAREPALISICRWPTTWRIRVCRHDHAARSTVTGGRCPAIVFGPDGARGPLHSLRRRRHIDPPHARSCLLGTVHPALRQALRFDRPVSARFGPPGRVHSPDTGRGHTTHMQLPTEAVATAVLLGPQGSPDSRQSAEPRIPVGQAPTGSGARRPASWP